jgi:uncharacterized protein YndB with AHSA1/START domain
MSSETTIRITRSFPSSRERVFRAWTNPEEIKKWWKIGEGWSLTIAEVDLRVGGEFRIGMRYSSGEATHLVKGNF